MALIVAKKVLSAFALALLVLIGLGLFSYHTVSTLMAANASRSQARTFLIELEATLSLLKDAETGQRGFLLTGDESYLEPYQSAVQQTDRNLDGLGSLIGDDPAQRQRLETLRRLAQAKLVELRRTVEAKQQGRSLEALTIVLTSRGKRAMDDIRKVVSDMRDAGFERLEQVDMQLDSRVRTLAALIIAGHILTASLVGLAVSMLIRDVARREQADVALRRQARLLDLSQDGILVRDLAGMITYWNNGAVAMYGRSKQEVVGQEASVLLKTVFPKPLPEIDAAILREGHWEGELTHTRGNGGQVTVASRWAVERDERAQPVGILEINSDITERKRFEHTLRVKNAELEEANRVKDRFLATMSHELRTPLNAIIGFTGTLLMRLPGPLTAEQQKQLKTIQSSAKLLLSLINDLLNLARIEAGKLELNLERINCLEVLEALSATIAPLAQAKGLTLDVKLPEVAVVVQADGRALHQILLNLASNAIKYTSEGGVTIELEDREHAGRRIVEFLVSDTGPGIAPEEQARLFQAFERLSGSTRGSQEGTGLGLYLSQKLAELMGGRITVQSVLGKGSTFRLVLNGPHAEGS
ncbi:MAG TPA: CHASE3 domain-containing protein [Isosphaeraceae bacterium]|nr:CHASE3 domain-containing protein [Isosphaeraceae bacterium]